jgi:hypothetical protein
LSPRAKIIYSGVWDVSSAFVVSHKARQYLFLHGYFDDELDDYPDTYKVFILPDLSEDVVRSSWEQLEGLASGFLGEIPIKEVEFDPMHRVWIDTKVIDAHLGT